MSIHSFASINTTEVSDVHSERRTKPWVAFKRIHLQKYIVQYSGVLGDGTSNNGTPIPRLLPYTPGGIVDRSTGRGEDRGAIGRFGWRGVYSGGWGLTEIHIKIFIKTDLKNKVMNGNSISSACPFH